MSLLFPPFKLLARVMGSWGALPSLRALSSPWNRSLVSWTFGSTRPELPVSIPACLSRASPATLAVLPHRRMAVLVPCCRLGSQLLMRLSPLLVPPLASLLASWGFGPCKRSTSKYRSLVPLLSGGL